MRTWKSYDGARLTVLPNNTTQRSFVTDKLGNFDVRDDGCALPIEEVSAAAFACVGFPAAFLLLLGWFLAG